MRKQLKAILLTILSFIISIPTIGRDLPKDFSFRSYSVDNGIPSNAISCITQDRDGYIWIGTDEGCSRFDGVHFVTYSASKPKEYHLPFNYVNSIHQDYQGTIWVSTNKGLCYKQSGEDGFSIYKGINDKQSNKDCDYYTLKEDENHNLWISTSNNGVYKINLENKSIKNYSFNETSQLVTGLYIDSQQTIWAITRHQERKLYRYNHTSDEFKLIDIDTDKNGEESFLTILEETDQYLWLGTWESGLQKYNKYSGKVTTEIPNNSITPLNHIHNLCRFNESTILISSDDGVMVYNTVSKNYKVLIPDELNPNSLNDRFVYPIFKDREGGFWIGSYYGGVNYLSPNFSQFDSYTHSRFKNSICGKVISCFCEDNKGNVWIGSDDGGLSKFNPESGIFTKQNNLSYNNVHALLYDDNKLWVGTYTGGLNVIDLNNGKIKVYKSSNRNNDLDDNSIYSIFKDSRSNIWIATMGGINRYQKESDDFYRVKRVECTTTDICEDNKGNIWFATGGKGLLKYNAIADNWKNYTSDNTNNIIPDNIVNSVYFDDEQNLWIGTCKGLCRYNPKSDSFIRVKMKIPSSNITAITGSNSALWLTTSKGLIYYKPNKKSIQIYSKSDGIQSDLFLFSSILKTSDGKIYVGSVNGFNSFYPHDIKSNSYMPPIVINSISVMNKPFDAIGEKIDIASDEKMFTIQFAALSYCTPQKNKYAYKMEGFDKDWIYVGEQSSATYTNLPAGTYTFKVKGCNNDGKWNNDGASIQIVIHPPLYLTLPFKMLYLLMTICIIAAIFHFIHKRTEKRHNENIIKIKAKNEEEMHQAKIAFFTMIAHEIRTPVSLIIGPLEKIMKNVSSLPLEMCKDLDIINRNSNRLLFLVNQLLDFRKVEQGTVQMHFQKRNIYTILNTIYERFQPSASQNGITININCKDKTTEACIDEEALTKIISNLLTNALKFTRDTINIECATHLDNRTFSIKIVDNGCGIAKEQQERIFAPFYQTAEGEMKNGTGIGLHIVKTLVNNQMGEIKLTSQKDVGSTFEVILPLDHEIDDDSIDIPTQTSEDKTTALPMKRVENSGPCNLLIVEDNIDMLEFIKSNFENGYSVYTALNGKEAMSILNQNDINVIISDWMMPEMDGMELCKQVRSNPMLSHLPFILLTARTDNMSKIESMDSGADMHIEKPFSIDFLKACIKNVIQIRKQLMQRFKETPLDPLNSIAKSSVDKEFLDKVNLIIEENFANNDLNVDLIAEKLNMSRSSFFAKIKNVTDITPNELIQLARMKKATHLLLEKRYRVNEISFMVGFNNPSYFSKCFQKQFGIKPLEFVQLHCGNKPDSSME